MSNNFLLWNILILTISLFVLIKFIFIHFFLYMYTDHSHAQPYPTLSTRSVPHGSLSYSNAYFEAENTNICKCSLFVSDAYKGISKLAKEQTRNDPSGFLQNRKVPSCRLAGLFRIQDTSSFPDISNKARVAIANMEALLLDGWLLINSDGVR